MGVFKPSGNFHQDAGNILGFFRVVFYLVRFLFLSYMHARPPFIVTS